MANNGDISPADDHSSATLDIALMEPRTVWRVERRLFYFNAAIATTLAIVIRFWKLALIDMAIMHVLAMWVTVKHPDMIAIYLRYRKQGDFYRPWVSPMGWVRNRRPDGFGRY